MIQPHTWQVPGTDWQCLKCGYSLRGLTAWRCPECGQAFDPEKPDTYRVPAGPRPPSALSIWLAKPPGKLFNTLVIVSSVLILLGVAVPFGQEAMLEVGMPLALLLQGIWALSLLHFLAGIPTATPPGKRRLAPWLIAPIALLLTVMTCSTHTPMRLALWFSQSRMDQLAQAAASGTPWQGPTRRWVGVYPMSIRMLPAIRGVRLHVCVFGQQSRGGFAHLPQGPPAGSNTFRYSRLRGNWYLFENTDQFRSQDGNWAGIAWECFGP